MYCVCARLDYIIFKKSECILSARYTAVPHKIIMKLTGTACVGDKKKNLKDKLLVEILLYAR